MSEPFSTLGGIATLQAGANYAAIAESLPRRFRSRGFALIYALPVAILARLHLAAGEAIDARLFASLAANSLAIAGLAALPQVTGRTARAMMWLGDMTYSSYLTHFPLQLVTVTAAALAGTALDWRRCRRARSRTRRRGSSAVPARRTSRG